MSRRLLLIVLLGLVAGDVAAQREEIRLDIEQGFQGLDGFVRPGSWTPIRLSVDNFAAEDRDVVLAWEHQDADGDRISAQRSVTLTRQRDDQPVWLYAAVPTTTNRETRWNLRATDAESGELLAAVTSQPNPEQLLRGGEQLIAVTSTADLGLNDYQRHETQQAAVRLVRGLSLSRLPDRWQGLEALSTFIWTQDLGGDPADPRQASEAALLSLREWVYRGGHLVVMLPEVGQTWTSSPLADMLPVTADQLRQSQTDNRWPFVSWIGGASSERVQPLVVTVFDVADGDPRATVVLRDEQQRALAVAGRYGFGRVTVVGVDYTAAAVRATASNNSQRRLWNHIFNWRTPVLTQASSQSETRAGRLLTADRISQRVSLIGFVPDRIAMSGTVGTLLLGAIFLFGIYWLLAGWLVQPVLKRKGLERLTWLGFVGLVAVFAGVAWGGAALLRLGGKNVAHVTVLDYDGNSGVARGRAYVSMFVPDFGRSEVATDSPRIEGLPSPVHNLLSSPGFSPDAIDTGFVDTQRYRVDAAAPDTLDVPVRATSKQLMVDYLGPVDKEMSGLAKPFSIGLAKPVVADELGWPVGSVRHTLPGTLTNVRVIYCQGERVDSRGERRQLPPQIWSYLNADGENRWSSEEPLLLRGRPDARQRETLYAPFRNWAQVPVDRDWKNEGFLGRRLGEQKGLGITDLPGSGVGGADESVIARHFELLTFFDALPPPDVKRNPDKADFIPGFVVSRRLAPRMDLTPLTQGRRLIILGHLRGSPLPVPLTVDGQTPDSEGWTVVRWVYDF
ncbi:MAG: hypothetical protein AAGH99_01935 [Planctomycetota bacterium]